jgi:carbamoyl-phosphate synthase large subunit
MKRADIDKVLIIGSGPIVIGQACEFDYSGTQACKALRACGYKVVLVNSNPATIMTDPVMADATYIEPLNEARLEQIIEKERPDAILPNLGGQTGLNLSMELAKKGILDKYGVKVIGVNLGAIERGEDREIFKETMQKLGIETPKSGIVHSVEAAINLVHDTIGYPVVVRPAYTMGGAGGGFCYNDEELQTICARGLDASLTHQCLIEESILNWEELEVEVVRDAKNQMIAVCFIENIDAVGVHTGDSFCAAPFLTISKDLEERLKRDAFKIVEAIGVIGGTNVQFAHDPKTGRVVIIEINPRTSRSSALASKATGFPIALVSAKLASGMTMDEIPYWRDGTLEKYTPDGDYVVLKFARWAFEKFRAVEDKLGTQMKAVGEVMSIGKTYKEAFQKAIRALERGRAGLGFVKNFHDLSLEELLKLLSVPNSERHFQMYEALRKGATDDQIFARTGVKAYFVQQMRELVQEEEEILKHKGAKLPDDMLVQAKKDGFSDKYLAQLLGIAEKEIRDQRKALGCKERWFAVPVSGVEGQAYYYSTYNDPKPGHAAFGEAPVSSNPKKVMILGGGPNRIGQGIEFDYCCCHAAMAMRKMGYETIIVNCNPETVSTDYDTSDKLYFEPVTVEDVLQIYEAEKPMGVIVQFGGQTPLNLAERLEAAGVKILGTSPRDIALAEDRDFFRNLVQEVGVRQPPSGIVHTVKEALDVASKIGYPVLVRPSFVLGGRGMAIVYHEDSLRQYVEEAVRISEGRPILIDKFLTHATELDIDCVSDGNETVIGAILEHIEAAGCHSGDAAAVTPPVSLSQDTIAEVERIARTFADRLHVVGLMNIQLAVKDGEVWMIEVNPRASRTVPFVSKAVGWSLAGVAARCMAGERLQDAIDRNQLQSAAAGGYDASHYCVKEAVFPFVKFPGADITLTPEMKSTGEVMAFGRDAATAYYKSQIAAGSPLPPEGGVILSVRDEDKDEVVKLARQLDDLGYEVWATRGTSTALWMNGVESHALYRIPLGSPNTLDLIDRRMVKWIVNIREDDESAAHDSLRIRSAAVAAGIPLTTTIAGFAEAVKGITAMKRDPSETPLSLQEWQSR